VKLQLLTCAQTTVVDQKTNALSVINILQEINSPVFPVATPGFTIASILWRETTEPNEPTDIAVKMRLNGKEIMNVPIAANFQGRLGLRHVGSVQGLLIEEPGELRVSFQAGEEPLGEWVILIRHVGQPTMANASALY
jgi:hypothetical protein